MNDRDVLWVVAKIARAIEDGRAFQAYTLTRSLAHCVRRYAR